MLKCWLRPRDPGVKEGKGHASGGGLPEGDAHPWLKLLSALVMTLRVELWQGRPDVSAFVVSLLSQTLPCHAFSRLVRSRTLNVGNALPI